MKLQKPALLKKVDNRIIHFPIFCYLMFNVPDKRGFWTTIISGQAIISHVYDHFVAIKAVPMTCVVSI